ncbi:Helix-turn-helix domain-containing protein [Actinoplanes philippinensis]|uniref:Helix-turn-helix domain-containing protein n=1 Tax=Actinoplanes philippinensis TaxID=35752 RepID=A0A1I2IUP1_9ACTN|nr:Helix-turn-helix domain-containing protein [Actinoplanes philippinensis]
MARNVRRLREARRHTVRSLSTRLGEIGRPILPSGITKIEDGTRRVDVGDLVALAEVLGVSPATLLMPGAPDGDKSWRARWRWMHGTAPLPDAETDPEEFHRTNRPYEDPNPIKAASNQLNEIAAVLSSGNIALVSFVADDGSVWDLEKRDGSR